MAPTAEAAPISSSVPPPNTVNYTIKRVTSESDIPALARLSDIALRPDSLHRFAERYNPPGLYEDTVQKLTNALRDTRGWCHLFKAVLVPESGSGGQDSDAEEIIVGLAQWKLGYAEIPKSAASSTVQKSDSSAPSEPSISGVAVADTMSQGHATVSPSEDAVSNVVSTHKSSASNPWEDSGRKLFSSYSKNIGDQRHLYLHRLIVHPSYQRQGIGQKLLDWGIEVADRENVVSWLFSRPVASKLYLRNGWEVVDIIEYNVPDDDIEVEPGIAMLRPSSGRNE
ncbi:acyl-CoA N-acyltransferase [Exophiala viscosa]|uniref:Acyl-CoA N-acyltransferase n=1 Tax=Exophiala viscosa TaxID=2486360 RepID=A0AAN6DRW5_9EURO|nr:acyl-CoA N-acyltransferase [Exophiala viscosa]